MACVDHSQMLRHRIDPGVVVDIPGDEHIRPLLQGGLHHAFPGAGRDGDTPDRLFAIPEHFDMFQMEPVFDQAADPVKRHSLLQVRHPADPLRGLSSCAFPRHFQGFPAGKPQDPGGKLRHARHIVVGVHGIAGNVMPDQL